ncbi:MAG: hypothetical protein IJ980_04475 [Oscillospiraceae bacterium]|nr:hypothetical protein [Oscillospiraceae bacterium]
MKPDVFRGAEGIGSSRPIFFCRAKRKRFLHSKRKGAWCIAVGAEETLRRAKIESTVRCASLPLLPSARKCIRFTGGAFGSSDLQPQQAAVWLLRSSSWAASAAAALGVESMQITHAGDRRMHRRIVCVFSFGHPKPFSFCKKKEKGVWETVSFWMDYPSGKPSALPAPFAPGSL